ncbi:uncharacterized protein LOC126667971 [Mercurialis annua]|uniref:uncharacterized protein LOC126667971 n=1 Tax=Mercurialis annua TaxID=3986 RepID=UPI00215EB910|nr:uncharacterized protein LOC126667971 [Mercurialis annua]
MEFQHQKTSSRDIFSFPSTPSTQDQDSDFEFGCLTTPDSNSPYKNSPADHLFYNGRLLPHPFPLQHQRLSHLTKDSLMSSRSNSVNSNRSCSSARTSSSSENSDRKLFYHTRKTGSCRSLSSSSSSSSSSSATSMASKVVMAQLYGSSQRWQHITPVLKREDSKRKINNNYVMKQGFGSKKELEGDDQEMKKKEKSSGFCLRFLKSILVACRECHSMEPPINDEIL